MIEIILMAVMAMSLIGMAACEMNDPLSRRFWKEVRYGRKKHGRRLRERMGRS